MTQKQLITANNAELEKHKQDISRAYMRQPVGSSRKSEILEGCPSGWHSTTTA